MVNSIYHIVNSIYHVVNSIPRTKRLKFGPGLGFVYCCAVGKGFTLPDTLGMTYMVQVRYEVLRGNFLIWPYIILFFRQCQMKDLLYDLCKCVGGKYG